MRWMQQQRNDIEAAQKSPHYCVTRSDIYIFVSIYRSGAVIYSYNVIVALEPFFFSLFLFRSLASLTASYLTTTSLFLLRLLRTARLYLCVFLPVLHLHLPRRTALYPKISRRQYEFGYFSVALAGWVVINFLATYGSQFASPKRNMIGAMGIYHRSQDPRCRERAMRVQSVECALHRCVRYTSDNNGGFAADNSNSVSSKFTSTAKRLRCGALESVNWYRDKQKRQNWENSIGYGMTMMACGFACERQRYPCAKYLS